jgi:hypothetical protein
MLGAAVLAIAFVVACFAHRLQLGTPRYVTSVLVFWVGLGTALCLLTTIVCAVVALIALSLRKAELARGAAILLVVAMLGLIAGMFIDSPTVVYAT